ncbi:MAG: hypothetical protein ACYTGC_14600, partial [Planctomycetota bacterium]
MNVCVPAVHDLTLLGEHFGRGLETLGHLGPLDLHLAFERVRRLARLGLDKRPVVGLASGLEERPLTIVRSEADADRHGADEDEGNRRQTPQRIDDHPAHGVQHEDVAEPDEVGMDETDEQQPRHAAIVHAHGPSGLLA